VLSGAPIVIGGVTRGTSIRGADNGTGNELVVPSAGADPTIGGSVILTEANFNPNSVFPAGFIALWWGSVLSIPNGWALCDGLDGRPDLKDRFVVGVGNSYVLGDTGGQDDTPAVNTAADGAHSHGGVTGSHVLTTAELASHSHTGAGGASFTGSTADNGGTGNYIVTASSEGYSASVPSFSVTTGNAGSGTGHTHTLSSEAAHTHAIAATDNRPPFMAMYYIIKVDPLGAYGGAGNPDYPQGDQYDMYDNSGSTTYIGGRSTQMQMLDRQAGSPQKLQIHCTASNVYKHTLTENVEVLPPNNSMSGQTINIILKQGGAGSFTVTWASVFKFPGGTPPVLSTAPGARDMLTCQYDSEDRVWMCVMSTNFS
jgi:microcystin-dependent protein